MSSGQLWGIQECRFLHLSVYSKSHTPSCSPVSSSHTFPSFSTFPRRTANMATDKAQNLLLRLVVTSWVSQKPGHSQGTEFVEVGTSSLESYSLHLYTSQKETHWVQSQKPVRMLSTNSQEPCNRQKGSNPSSDIKAVLPLASCLTPLGLSVIAGNIKRTGHSQKSLESGIMIHRQNSAQCLVWAENQHFHTTRS